MSNGEKVAGAMFRLGAKAIAKYRNGDASRNLNGLEAYLRDHNAALLPTLREAWQEYERAIAEGREY